MATKEEIEAERNDLREENDKLKMRYKEIATKLEIARLALQAQAEVMDNHLKLAKPVDYKGHKPGEIIPMKEKEN